MASLTKCIRESIRNKVIRHRFGTDETELAKLRGGAGDRVYDALYSKAHRGLMNAAPDGFYARRNTAYVFPPGTKNHTEHVRWTGYKPMPYCDVHGAHSPKLQAEHGAIWQAYRTACAAVDALEHTKQAAIKELDGALAGFTTLKQLRDNWPELGDFIPADPVKTGNNLVRVKDELNQKYKLPPEGKKDEAAAPA